MRNFTWTIPKVKSRKTHVFMTGLHFSRLALAFGGISGSLSFELPKKAICFDLSKKTVFNPIFEEFFYFRLKKIFLN